MTRGKDNFDIGVRIEEGLFGALSTSDCHQVGISGGCGLDCHVYLSGRCEVHDEMVERFETQEDAEEYEELYRDKNK
ncbi:hypothetical protein [Bacillus mycoides]|uniref:hypothetical protein n=1 Tax=Bacillus mycoides TaxID=1405 RepID=UPI003A80B529